MNSASNFAKDFHFNVKVICNDEAIIQKPLPRATESVQFVLDQTSTAEVFPCQMEHVSLKLNLNCSFDMEILLLLRFVSNITISIKTTTYRYFYQAVA